MTEPAAHPTLCIPTPREPVDPGTGSRRVTVAGDRAPRTSAPAATGPRRRNRVWAVVGHTGTVVTLAAALTICATIAARVDGSAGAQHPPSSTDGAGLQPVPLGRP